MSACPKDAAAASLLPGRCRAVRLPVATFLAILFSCLTGVALAQPANELFENPDVLAGPSGSTNGSNVDASEAGEPTSVITSDNGPVDVSNTIWFQWMATNSGYVTFDTVGSVDGSGDQMDTVLAAYTGSSLGSLTLVTADDDINDAFNSSFAIDNPNSYITFYAVSGTTYNIAVDLNADTGASPGNCVLNWNDVQPTNDVFTNITVLGGTNGTVSGGNFNAIVPSSATNQIMITATNDLKYGGLSMNVSNSVWFSWVAPTTGVVTFNTIGSADLIANPMDTVLAVWTGTNVTDFSNLTLVASDDDTYDDFNGGVDYPGSSVTVPVKMGTNYYISVYLDATNGGYPGNYVLNWSAVDPVNTDAVGFTHATTISGSTGATNEINLNSTNATKVGTSDNGLLTVGNCLVFKWRAPQTGNFTFNTAGSLDEISNQMDTVLAVYDGTTLSQKGADDNYGDLTSSVTFPATSGTTYYILVGVNQSSGGLGGTVALNWSPVPAGAPTAGEFQFTSPAYQFSQTENQSSINGVSVVHNGMNEIRGRATITRIGGADGMAEVGYYLTNAWYNNYTDTITYQVSIQTTINTNNMGVNGFDYTTNAIYTTNDVVQAYENYNGNFFYMTNATSGYLNLANSNGVVSYFPTNGLFTNGLPPVTLNPPQLTSTNYFGTNYYISGAISADVIAYTNEIITNIIISVQQAINTDGSTNYTTNSLNYTNLIVGVYVPSWPVSQLGELGPGTAVFNDYQMNYDVPIGTPTALMPNDVNPLAIMVMTNASLDPNEDPSLPEPTVSGTRNAAYVSFLNTYAIAADYGGGGNVTNVFNFAASTIRCEKTVGGGAIAYVGVVCPNHYDNTEASVHYLIDYGGSSDNNNDFNLQAGSDYARPDNAAVYTATTDFISSAESPGALTFPANSGSASFIQYIPIPITQDTLAKFNQDIQIQLYYPSGVTPQSMDGYIGNVSTCTLTVELTTPPAGSVDTSYMAENVPGGNDPEQRNPGANGQVNAIVVQPSDGKAVIGGAFTSFTAVGNGAANYIARLDTEGALDTTFNTGGFYGGFGGGFIVDGTPETPAVQALALDTNQNIIAVGQFTSFKSSATNSISAGGIARLLPTGAADPAFDNAGSGANNNVWAVALQANGQIIIGGDFTSYNGTNCNHIARLNTDGSLDTSFNPGIGPNNSIYSVAVQNNGAIVIGGDFTNVDGVNLSGIARLNADGSLDNTFSNLYTGLNGAVDALAVQTNGEILAGGNFTSVQGQTNLTYLVRLNPDGSVDSSFEDGTGPNNTVRCIALQSDGTFYIGGYFTSVNGTRRVGIARLLPNGWVDTSFMDTAYNQFAGLPNPYYSGDPFYDNGDDQPNPVNAIAVEPVTPPPSYLQSQTYDVLIGGSFSQVGGDGGIPTDENSIFNPSFDRENGAIHPRLNVARLIGGSTPGPGNIEFSQYGYSAESISPIQPIQLQRVNGTLGSAAVNFQTVQEGTGAGYAQSNVDYVSENINPTWGVSWGDNGPYTWMMADGLYGVNNDEPSVSGYNWYDPNPVNVTIISNNYPGSVSVNLQLAYPKGQDSFFLGGNHTTGGSPNNLLGGFGNPATVEGENIPLGVALGYSSAPLVIQQQVGNPGILSLSASYYYTNESAGNATLEVTRTGGSSGTVTLNYSTTTNNTTAVPGRDYVTTSGTLQFSGAGSLNIVVPIISYRTNQPDRTFGVKIYSPGGGASLGAITNATVEIINNNVSAGVAEFVNGTPATNTMYYGVNENDSPALISVARLGGSSGIFQVILSVTNGTATNGINYLGPSAASTSPLIWSTNLVWNNGISGVQTISLPILDTGSQSTNLTVKLKLSNATVNGSSITNYGAYTNAVLTITNTDLPGTVEFTSPSYLVNENAGYALVPIIRTGGSAGSLTAQFYTLDGTATNGINYFGVSNSVVFAPGQISTNIIVAISNLDSSSDFNFYVVLANPSPTNALGSPNVAQITINGASANEEPPGQPDPSYNPSFNAPILALALQPNGQLLAGGEFTLANGLPRQYLARLNADGSLDLSFLGSQSTWGANAPVEAVALGTNGLILVGGEFTVFDNAPQSYIARLNVNGSLDTGFNSGGANNTVYALASETNGEILVGGAFTTFGGIAEDGIVQLLGSGAVDTSFNASANATVYAVAIQPNGQILVGGDFTNVDGVAVNHIARLNADGSLDYGFTNAISSQMAGANASVHAIAVQLDGRILIGGYFTNVDGVPCNYIARLNQDGSLDATFTNALANPAMGANGPVNTITLQPDTRIVVGGSFTQFNGVTRNNVTRLNPNGGTDYTIDFGAGADGFVAASVIQNDGNIDLGGGFLNFASQPHPYLARIYGGSIAGSGNFSFSAGNYQVAQNGIVAPVTIIRSGGTSGTNTDGSGNVYVTFETVPDGSTATAGVNYSSVSNVVIFPAGEVQETVNVPVMVDPVITPASWLLNLWLTNPAPASVVSLGNQPTAALTILNTGSGISFSSGLYSVANNVAGGQALVNLFLQGYTNATSSVVFSTTGGSAVPGVEYMPVSPTTVTFNPGVTDVTVSIPIITDTNYTGNQTVNMSIFSPSNAYLLSPSNATLTIVDTANAAGQLFFASSNYTVNESSGQAVVSVLYTNGDLPVSVYYTTVPGTAQPGVNYQTASGTLNFSGSLTAQPITVTLPQYNVPEGPVSFSIILSNALNGATLIAPSNTVITILDDLNTGVAFDTATNAFEETNGVVSVLVDRLGVNTNIAFSVDFATTNGTALAGTNYVSTNGVLTFSDGQTQAVIPVTLMNNSDFTNLQFSINLFSNTAPSILGSPSNTVVVVEPSETALSFVSTNTSILKTAGYAILPVMSSGPNLGPVAVNYSTGGGSAVPGVDYTATSGTLIFTNGQAFNYILVPILPNTLVQSNQTFNVTLSSPTYPGILVPPSTETVTIIETNTPVGLNFYSPIATNSDWGTATIDDNNPLAILNGGLVWFAWTPTNSGEVEFDTIGSVDDVLGVTNLATAMGVFTGNNFSGGLAALNWLTVNDGIYLNPQQNDAVTHIFSVTNATGGPVIQNFADNYYQPFAGPSPAGPSEVRFDAVAGQTYYIAVETYPGLLSEVQGGSANGGNSQNTVFSPSFGLIKLNWALHPSGDFKFASEYVDQTGLTYSNGIPMVLYNVSETETTRHGTGTIPVDTIETTVWGTTIGGTNKSAYRFDIPGLQVTVTRMAGSSGEVHVNYTTEDITQGSSLMGTNGYLLNGDEPAQSNVDYVPVSGTLTFADSEVSKTIFVPILDNGGYHLNRDFLIVLTNANLDSAESPDVQPPRLDPTFNTAVVRILSTGINPEGPSFSTTSVTNITFNSTNVTTTTTYNLEPTNAVFDFQKAHYQVTRDISDYWGKTIYLYVNRFGTNNDAETLTWKVDAGYLDINNSEWNESFALQPGSDYATPDGEGNPLILNLFPDFDLPASGTISFPAGQHAFDAQPITFTVYDNGLQQFNEDFIVNLYKLDSAGNPHPVGMVDQASVTILFDDNHPPAGSVDEFYNADFSYNMAVPMPTVPPQMSHPGTDGEVEGLAVQPDNKSIIVGDFSTYDQSGINNIARINTDGSLDTSFSPGSGPNEGPNAFVSCIALTTNYESVIGGGFTSYSGNTCNGIALVQTNGALDTTFNPGNGFSLGNVNGTVYALAFETNGEILVGGDFTSYNGLPCDNLALLNLNGTLDTSFNAGTNLNAAVHAIAVEPNGQIIVGGDFTSVAGVNGQDYLARLNPDGSFDPSFDPGSGANNSVFALGIQPDGNIVVGGEFTTMNGQAANNIARLTPNGFIDSGFNLGVGADGPVYNITVATNTVYWTTNTAIPEQTNFTVYIGGSFTSINGTHRLGFARLNPDGSLDTTFLDTAYNEFAGLPRDHYDDPRGTVLASGVQSDGNIMIGGSFSRVGGGQSDDLDVRPEIVDTNDLEVAEANPGYDQTIYPSVQKTRAGVRNRSNVARLIGGATPGPGNVGLLYNSYSINKSQSPENVSLIRTNGCLGPASANFSVLPGLAQSGVDYSYNGLSPLYWIAWEDTTPSGRMRSDGFFGTNDYVEDPYGRFWSGIAPEELASVPITIFDNTNNFNNLNAQFQLSAPVQDQFFLGGQDIPLGVALGQSTAPFTLIDDHEVAGTFGFSAPSYTTTNQTAVISIIRTNGNNGQVNLSYATTTNGSTAVLNSDYQGASGTLTFSPGDTVKAFSIPILYTNSTSSSEKTVSLMLFGLNPPANTIASWGISNAVLRIINPNFQGFLSLSSNAYNGALSAGSAVITVTRTVGSRGPLSVLFSTANGSAVAGTDYQSVTTNLQWSGGDASPRTVVIPFLPNDSIGGAKQFTVSLSNPQLNGVSTPSLFATNAVTNAVVTINNNNSYGSFAFSQPAYIVNENGGYATLTVLRTGGTNGTASVQYATADGTALQGVNYLTNSGTLTFVPGQLAASFTVAISNLDLPEPPPSGFYFSASLSSSQSGVQIGSPSAAQVQIVSSYDYNQIPGSPDTSFNLGAGMNGNVFALALQANGQILAGGNFSTVDAVPENNLARLNADGSLDRSGFMYGLSGVNGPVYSVAVQTDGQILVGGSFTNINGSVINNLARLNTDGSLDSSFNVGAGAGSTVYAVAEAFLGGSRVIYAGGSFGSMNGQSAPFISRLTENGAVDSTFSVGAGPGAAVYAIAVYPTNSPFAGDVLIGGAFTNVNNFAVGGIARLTSNGSIDTNFDANLAVGAQGAVRAIAIQSDGRVLIGGDFTNVDGVLVNYVARLNADGSLDASFAANLNVGANAPIDAIAIQADNRIVVAGQFTQFDGVTRNGIARLLPAGALDAGINFGYGANGAVNAAVIQPANQYILIGGSFTQYDGQPAGHVARIYGGSITGSGSFEFGSPNYQVIENGIAAPITILRTGGTSASTNGSGAVYVNFATLTNGSTAMPNFNYVPVSTNVAFPPGEVLETVAVQVLSNSLVTPSQWTLNLGLSNPTPPASILSSNATLTILNDNSFVGFSSASYTVPKDINTGLATLNVARTGAANAACSVNLVTTTNGTAQPGVDFIIPTNTAINFAPGQTNVAVPIQIINNANIGPNLTVIFTLTNAVNTLLTSPTNTTLTIINTSTGPGQLYLSATNYTVNESGLQAVITVLRTNGFGGSVSANYATADGTAVSGLNYQSASGSVTLNDGAASGTFAITLLENNPPETPVSFSVALSNPGGGASLIAPTNATVTINDDINTGAAFLAPTNYFMETNGVVAVPVQRLGNLNSAFSVQYATANGTALAGVNYFAASGTLSFVTNETQAGIFVTLTNNEDVSNLTFSVTLTGASPGIQLLQPNPTVVVETPAAAGLTLASPTNSVLKNSGSINTLAIPVICLDPSNEPVILNSNSIPLTVNYATADGTALANQDYYPTNGTLVFTNGVVTNFVTVGIINNTLITGLRTFSLNLSNPQPVPPAKLVSPASQVITIIDNNSGLSFSGYNYYINGGGLAPITVVRVDNTNTTSTVAFATVGGGTAASGTDYQPTNGMLTFLPGQTTATFSVNVFGSSVVQPNKTVVLQLSNPTNGILTAPNVATLNIYNQNGGDIVPVGVSLAKTNGAPNGILQSNQMAYLYFGFRDAGGLNVANLFATLLPSANIVPTNGVPETRAYGPLTVNGPSASQQFSLTPVGTNGQTVLATFALQAVTVNNTTNYETNAFGLTIGSWTTTFYNTNPIYIYPAPMNYLATTSSPYPSVITVSNVGGVLVGGTTVTLTNFTATSPQAVGVLVVSPQGQDTLLMAGVGTANVEANKVTLTFSDAATNTLPANTTSAPITNGVYQPTQDGSIPNFP